tara:strand:- start:38492 stop:38623 length:132 start_codon:yes stop_codon:yes gene_type:complete
MLNQLIPLYNHGMGVMLIGVFALVCVILVVVLVSFMYGGKKKK